MFRKNKKMCSCCKTGKETYALDKRSEVCPYIYSYTGNSCSCYVPLENDEKGAIKRFLRWLRLNRRT